MSLQIDEDVRPRIWVGKEMSAREYLEILQQREEIKRSYDEALAGVDAYLTPTTDTPAIPLTEVDQAFADQDTGAVQRAALLPWG